jgi:poly(3-hydroxybutyrate) depolymerase
MIEHTDDAIGKVWQAVEACGLAEKTVVVFLSDNGGVDNKMTGARKEFEGIPVTSNAPLRGGKGDIYEGGVRIPGFVIWPGKTKAGSECAVPFNSVDLLPTLAEICGFKELPQWDGRSFVAALRGAPMAEAPLFIHYPHYGNFTKGGAPATSVVFGGWKLIQFYFDGPGQKHRYELYDLANDPGEKRNLSRSHPERVESLRGKIAGFVQLSQAVLPIPNPEYQDAVESEFEGMKFQLFQPELLPNRKYPLILCLPDRGGEMDNVAFAEFQRTEMQFGKPVFLLAPANSLRLPGLNEKMTEGTRNGNDASESPQIGKLVQILKKVLQEYPIDPRRVYVTGGAGGGTATWEIVARHPELFAAAVPVNGSSSPSHAARLGNLPVWIFHGKGDSRVPAASAQKMHAALRSAGSTAVKYTEFSGTAAEAVEEVWRAPEVIQWLLEQKQVLNPQSSLTKPTSH